MLVQFRADVDGGGLNSLEEHLCYAWLFDVDQVRLEHAFRSFVALGADFDRAAVREGVGLDESRGLFSQFRVDVKIIAAIIMSAVAHLKRIQQLT